MSNSFVIQQARIVNEDTIIEADLRVQSGRIAKIARSISATGNESVFDANGKLLIPGMIDDQVHFREPGLTHKGTIATESRAAVAGGITSYMEMPNVNPATTTLEALEKKYAIAHQHSMANYAFYLGATEDNLEQIKRLDPRHHCGVKVFMGASTGNLLVENPAALESIFAHSPVLIVTHCESGPLIAENLAAYDQAGLVPTIQDHPRIRNTEACFASSSYAVALAKQFNSQLHVLHITTAKELHLFERGNIANKSITAEACVHHLWFSDHDYAALGNLIKCNPAIKTEHDRLALLQAVNDDVIDIIATDHAPHTLMEKQLPYHQSPAGLPLVQHALLSLFDQVSEQRLNVKTVVKKTSHNPAIRYAIKDRGFIREGYHADLVLIDQQQGTLASHSNARYLCGWTPFDQHQFKSRIDKTWVNGQLVFDGDKVLEQPLPSQRLQFYR